MPCAPQRYMANNRNALRAATLTPSSVRAAPNLVLAVEKGRDGTAQAALTGAYTGSEEALYEIAVTSAAVGGVQRVSAPVFAGAGSGTLTGIVATGTPQTYTVELHDAGQPAIDAALEFEGVRLVARSTGTAGNLIRIAIDQTPLVLTASDFSLAQDLGAGDGGESSDLTGQGYDWQTARITPDGIIPADAKRVCFDSNINDIYVQYKQYEGNRDVYHFVPAIRHPVKAGARVYFVTGGRDISISNGTTTEPDITGVATLYDFLAAVKSSSALLDVAGVVANDRTPSGQASRELTTRTDAHAETVTHEGSAFVGGFDFLSVDPTGARTELITVRCVAVTPADHPLAHLGRERWSVNGTVSGDLGIATTGELFTDPGGKFAFTIGVKLPDNANSQSGQFSLTDVSYASRQEGETPPPICVVALTLGGAAIDQSITLEYTRRPTGDCLCADMPIPKLSASCLGIVTQGGDSVTYDDATNARLVDLYDWQADTVHAYSEYAEGRPSESPFIAAPSPTTQAVTETLLALVADFEGVIAAIGALDAGSYRTAAETAWDAAVTELKADVAETVTIGGAAETATYPAHGALVAGDGVSIISVGGTNKATKGGIVGAIAYGFVTSSYSDGATATVHFFGLVPVPGSILSPGNTYWLQPAGDWQATLPSNVTLQGVAVNVNEIYVPSSILSSVSYPTAVQLGLLRNRYQTRLQTALISGGISPLGKNSASILESGDGCWRDIGDAFYWTVHGAGGEYAWAFNNTPYYSSRKASEQGKFYSTHEFGFQINVKCVGDLREGDRITLAASGSARGTAYQIGDTITAGIVAAQPQFLGGGHNADPVQTWFVSGSTDGPLPAYSFNPSAPAAYTSTDLAMQLVAGGVPYALGDKFTFAVEGGTYHWRKTVGGVVGAWSATADIPLGSVAIDAGLSLSFNPGNAPSFVAGDVYAFRALQPYAASNVQSPGPEGWAWQDDGQTLFCDSGEVLDADCMLVAFHTLPVGAVVTLEGGVTLGLYDWSETLTVTASDALAQPFAAVHSARYWRWTILGAPDAQVGFLWAGMAVSVGLGGSFTPQRAYKMGREGAAGRVQFAKFQGKAVSFALEYTEAALLDADVQALWDMVDWVKTHDDEPLGVLPHVDRPEECYMVQVGSDNLEFAEISGLNRNPEYDGTPEGRRWSVQIPLNGVYQ